MTDYEYTQEIVKHVQNGNIAPEYARELICETKDYSNPDVFVSMCRTSRAIVKTKISDANKAYKAKNYDKAIAELKIAETELERQKDNLIKLGKSDISKSDVVKAMTKVAAVVTTDVVVSTALTKGTRKGINAVNKPLGKITKGKASIKKSPRVILPAATIGLAAHTAKKKIEKSREEKSDKQLFQTLRMECLRSIMNDLKKVRSMIAGCEQLKKKAAASNAK